MLYPYAEFPNHLIITYSEVKPDKTIHVNFEQPTDWGFKEARYSLPSHKVLFNDGFTPSKTKLNEEILTKNEKLIVEFAKEGGVELA